MATGDTPPLYSCFPAVTRVTARLFGNRTAFSGGPADSPDSITHHQLHVTSGQLARHLADAYGIGPGTTVATYMHPSAPYVTACMAILKSGATLAPLWDDGTGRGFRSLANLIKPAFMFCDEAKLQAVHEWRQSGAVLLSPKIFAVPAALSGYVPSTPAPWSAFSDAANYESFPLDATAPVAEGDVCRVASLDDCAMIVSTSGTTGPPSGVMWSHRGLALYFPADPSRAADPLLDTDPAAAKAGFEKYWKEKFPPVPIGCGERALNPAPTLRLSLLSVFNALAVGGELHCLPAFDAGTTIKRLLTAGPYHVAWLRNGQLLSMFSHPDFAEIEARCAASPDPPIPTLRTILYGSTFTPPPVIQRTLTTFRAGMVQLFGLTESLGAGAVLAPPDHVDTSKLPADDVRIKRMRSCGQGPFIKVVNPSTLEVLPPDVEGEVVLGGPRLFMGYFGDEKGTREVLCEINGETYLRTGDLGVLDKDGYLYLQGRNSDLMNLASGQRISTVPMELDLSTHPDVASVAIVGAKSSVGEVAVAFIVPATPAAKSRLTVETVSKWLVDKGTPAARCPVHVFFMDELPFNGDGKVLKPKLARDAAARLTNPAKL